ncbi:MAG: hypothetical protein VXY53_08215, partial [Candidatus Thermoplasmatota archaeon]|nr:hypothetical protein [Candidatus Thermoplasmatota archaeon]
MKYSELPFVEVRVRLFLPAGIVMTNSLFLATIPSSDTISVFETGTVADSPTTPVTTGEDVKAKLDDTTVSDIVWVEIEKWVKNAVLPYDEIVLIGSGG